MGGFLSVRSSIVIYQFGELLSTFELPGAWRKAIAERCRAEAAGKDEPIEHVFQRRKELGEEQKRPVEAIAEERRDMVWAGASLRQIARPFETSHGAIWLAKKAGWE